LAVYITYGYITIGYIGRAFFYQGIAMVALPDWAQRVGTLRKELGLKQVQFAAKFGVTQAAISRWESGAKEPSAENYIRMGNMAAKPGCFWFLEKAGVDVTRLRRLFLEEKAGT